MLFNDSEVLSADELKLFDAQVTAIAQSEGVPLDGPNGLIRRVVDECGAELMSRLAPDTPDRDPLLWRWGGRGGRRISLDQIVVGGEGQFVWAPIRSWIAQRVLAAFYRVVQSSNKAELYERRAAAFSKQAVVQAWNSVENNGLPCVANPLLRPGASRVAGSGGWDLRAVFGIGSPGAYDVALSYFRQTDGAESAMSERSRMLTEAQQHLAVSIAGLRPPASATHWNIYAGPADGQLTLQTPAPVALSQKTAEFAPTTSGRGCSSGQAPDFIQPFYKFLGRI